jgi:hypothetical protein
MNAQQQPLSPELLILLEHLTNSTGHRLVELGDGIICLAGNRQNQDSAIPCTVAFDPDKWTLGDKIAKPWQCTFSFMASYISGDGTEGGALQPDVATGFIRLLLRPRKENLKFYTVGKNVTVSNLIEPTEDSPT